MFLASSVFFLTFGVLRLAVHAAHAANSDFRVLIAGVHVHHLVWGIVLLLLVGYVSLVQRSGVEDGESKRLGRWCAILYGVGAALTLDEFALWLRLDDVYWEREGRASVDVAMLFGALVSCGLWGGPFFRAVTRQVARMIHRRGAREAPRAAASDLAAPVGPVMTSAAEATSELAGAP